MCYVLTAEKILLNYFSVLPKKISISFEEIAILSCLAVRKCNNSIITRITEDDIKLAVYQEEGTFKLENASVVLNNRESPLLVYIDMYNQTTPEYVLKRLIKSCKELHKCMVPKSNKPQAVS